MYWGNEKDELDIGALIKVAQSYYKFLREHIEGNVYLSQDMIKYLVNHILEICLIIEDRAKDVYDQLDEEIKDALVKKEEERNKYLFNDEEGYRRDERAIENINNLLEAQEKRYREVRDKTNEKVNFS